jgi:hypothetical protein
MREEQAAANDNVREIQRGPGKEPDPRTGEVERPLSSLRVLGHCSFLTCGLALDELGICALAIASTVP